MGNGVIPVSKNSVISRNGEYCTGEISINSLERDLHQVRRKLEAKENQVSLLQKEVHKLKCVLQQTKNSISSEDILKNYDISIGTVSKTPVLQKSFSTNTIIVYKKQGISAESGEFLGQFSNANLTRINKEYRSKQLIKEAVMKNDFLMKLDPCQVRDIVDTMYPEEFQKDSYVIKEGDIGSHLYVSDDGDLEVIKDEECIGRIESGEVFGELAILYNCTRTASIKAATDCKVWVLERKIFQHIMIRTGIQRQKDKIDFLKSIPLLRNLNNDTLAKIADVFKIDLRLKLRKIVPSDSIFWKKVASRNW